MDSKTILDAATGATDKFSGVGLLQKIFGDGVVDPLSMLSSGGGGGSILGSMFSIFSLCVMSLGAIYMTYAILMSVSRTAHEGEFAGKKFDGVWTPIRMLIGFASLVPAFGGWALCQVLMIWFAVMGVGIANMTWTTAIDYVAAGGSLSQPTATPASKDLARDVLLANLCVESANAGYFMAMNQDLGAVAGAGRAMQSGRLYGYGTATNDAFNQMCGSLQFPSISRAVSGISADQNFETRKAVANAVVASVQDLQTAAQIEAEEIVKASVAHFSTAATVPMPTNLSSVTARLSARYESNLRKNVAAVFAKSNTNKFSELLAVAKEQATSRGFVSAGNWYSVIAQVNSLGDISELTPRLVKQPDLPTAPRFAGYSQTWQTVRTLALASASQNQGNLDVASGEQTVAGEGEAGLLSALKTTLCGGQTVSQGLGQCLISSIVRSGNNESAMLRMKNAGDYLSTVGAAGIAAIGAIDGAAAGAKASVLTSLTPIEGSISGAAAGAVHAFADLAATGLKALVIFGVTLSVWVPMVPVVIWIAAIIAWLLVVVEAVAAAPLWALVHLDDGEGMGQRAQHGYLFIVNLLFRPTLMIFGFVLAGVIVEVAGGLWTETFSSAVASAQADSVSGLVMVVAFVGVYVLTCLVVVNMSFNAVHLVPNQVLSWVGGTLSTHVGDGKEDIVSTKTGAAASAVGGYAKIGSASRQRSVAPPPEAK